MSAAVLDMDFPAADAAVARLRALFTRKGREGRDLPEWADEYVAATGGLRDVLGLLDWPGERAPSI